MITTTYTIESLLAWGPPEPVATRRGTALVRKADIDRESFWQLYRQDREGLRQAGVQISKFRGKWSATWWLDGPLQPDVEEPAPPTGPDGWENTVVNEAGLMDWQIANLKRLVTSFRAGEHVLGDFSDTGTGKTYTAAALARELGLRLCIIAPKAVLPAWREAADHIGASIRWAVNYEALKPACKRHRDYVAWSGTPPFPAWHAVDADDLLVFDEAHRCKAFNGSLNSKLLVSAAKAKHKILLLSATIAESPLHLRAAGFAFGLHRGSDFWEWASQHGCRKNRWDGWEFDGNPRHVRRIRNILVPRKAVRAKIADIPSFPETRITADIFDFGDEGKIQKVYNELESRLDKIKSDVKNYGAGILTEILAARRKTEMLKVPGLIEAAHDAVEEGSKVLIFTNFLESLEELAARLKCPTIRGGQEAEEREAIRKAFQNDESGPDILVAQIHAGGVGISLHGPKPRRVLICPDWSAAGIKQALGRVHRTGGGPSWQSLLYAAGSIEEQIARRVRDKLSNIDLLNDGDTTAMFHLPNHE
jgi:hypothetical protein